jgi:type IV pilus assembly protein PilM
MNTSTLGFLESLTKKIQHGTSFVGIDMGSSSTKIVQLGIRSGQMYIDTYGEISNASYALTDPGQAVRPEISKQSDEIQDLMHEIDARSRLSGVAIPFSETLMSVVDLPKRDKAQMDKIVPIEAQKFIPVPIDEIMIDWYDIPEEDSDAFDVAKSNQKVEAQFQKVMIVGINKKIARSYHDVVTGSGLVSAFFEIETFSALRASLHAKSTPTLLIDFGASSTKAAIVNERWVLLVGRVIPVGGAKITADIAKLHKLEFTEAERSKCEQGLRQGTVVHETIEKSLSEIWPYISQIIGEHDKINKQHVDNVLIYGGGAYMPGLREMVQEKLSLPTKIMNGFSKTRGPMILEDVIAADGARYAVAVGLAIRGLGK